jgi:hypothetical protein
MVKRKRLTSDQALSALLATRSIPIRLVSVDVALALQLAADFGFTPTMPIFYIALWR